MRGFGSWLRAPLVRRRKRIELSQRLAELKKQREKVRESYASWWRTLDERSHLVKSTPESSQAFRKRISELKSEGDRKLAEFDAQIRAVEKQLGELERKQKKK